MDLPKGATPATEQERLLREGLSSFPRFCGLLKVPPKEGGERLPFRLSPIQAGYTRARSSRDIILKPRQVYMTTLEAARDIWWFLTKPGARVLLVCQSQGDQGALKDIAYKFRVFFDCLERIGLNIPFGERSTTSWTIPSRDATMRIIQAGGSEIAAGRKGRGGTVNRLHMTEMAFWGDYAASTFASLTDSVPMDGSEVVNESTANGASGLYFEQWRAAVDGKSAYKTHFFEWWKHPAYKLHDSTFAPRTEREVALLARGVTAAALAWYRWKISDKAGDEQIVRQEFPDDAESCFLVTGRTFFNAAKTASLLLHTSPAPEVYVVGPSQVPVLSTPTPEEIKRSRTVRIWHTPKKGRQYVLALDPSEGTGGDPAAGILLDRGSGLHCATIWGQYQPDELARIGATVGYTYNTAEIACERNNHGHAVLQALGTGHQGIGLSGPYPNVFHDSDEKRGWNNTGPARTLALDTIEQAHRQGHFETPDAELAAELRTFIVTATGKAEAAGGTHDDLVLALTIAWSVICRVRVKRDGTNLPHR